MKTIIKLILIFSIGIVFSQEKTIDQKSNNLTLNGNVEFSNQDFNIWDVNYSTRETCSPYIFGAWGVAYLLHKVDDQDKFWKSFWPTIDEKGWDSAFEASFGITMDQFNKEFLEFLKLPIEKQLEIIPNI